MAPKGMILQHTIVGSKLLTNFEFDSDKPFTCCLLCGVVYQTEADRAIDEESTYAAIMIALDRRKTWAQKHAAEHPTREHELLRMSGRLCTPEALEKLVPYGIVLVSDMVLSDEHAQAGAEAPRAPLNDAVDL